MTGGSLTKLGTVLVVAGALLMAGPIFGFSTLAADRGVNVATAEDANALLGIETNDGAELGKNQVLTVANLTNNVGSDIDTLETTVQPGILSVGNDFASQLAAGESTSLGIECGDATGTGNETIDFTVSEATSSAAGLSISLETVSVDVSYDCGGRDSGGNFTVTDVRVSNSTVEFDVKNDGTSVDISGLSLDDTTTAATSVDNGPEAEVTFDTALINQTDGSLPIDGSFHEFTNTNKYVVENGDTVTVTIKSFQDNDSTVDMTGEELLVTLYEKQGGDTPVEQLTVSDAG